MIMETDLSVIDITAVPPEEEPQRQQYYMARIRAHVDEFERRRGRRPTACVRTFGCQMNERDSEKLRGILRVTGFEESEDEDADLVLYNTCTVRENANQKVYGHLGGLAPALRANPDRIIGLCGCMMQEKGVTEKIRESYRFVSLVFGTHNIYKFAELLERVIAGRLTGERTQVIEVRPEMDRIVEDLPASRTYPFKSGVNIMYGCNNFCTYCIVPYVRGREKSRRPVDILREIERLADDGVTEIMLLGQNVNSYGKGLDEACSFAQLLREAEKIDGISRIRFMTSHPKDLSDDLIEVMAGSQKICPHLHLPLQSGSTPLLKKMNRHYTKEDYLALCGRLKAAMPDLSLTTDLIVGFPGETEEDFRETLDVVRRVRFDSAFTFIYSRRTGTPAASWEQVPEDVIRRRFDTLLSEVQTIGREQSSRFTGSVQEVLVEQVNRQDGKLVTGRTPHNLVVHVPGDAGLIGTTVPVYLKEARGFYYIGERA